MRRALAKVAQMPKFYAVSKGREGPKVYKTWDECKENVSRFPGAVHKAFSSMEQAETWLASSLSLQTSNPSQTVPRSTDPRRSQRPYNQDKRLRLNVPSQIPSAPSSSSNAEASTSSMSLSAEQQAVLERVSRGQSTFFSGSAGTGKSVLLRAIIDKLGGFGCPTLGITASTGIAGINIGGTTLHSWAGIGIGNEPAKKIGGMFLGQQKYERVLKRWRTVKTLIIDEISMVDGALFDKLVWPGSTQYMYWRSELIKQEEIARIVRKKDAPFGGIQLVLSGDFFQLPPVPNKHGDKVTPIVFAFDSKTWATCVGPPVTLTHVFRQKDQAFVDLLNAMRFGKVENVEAFKALERKVTYTDGIQPTELLSRRDEVDRANMARLNQLPGDCQAYMASDYCGHNSNGERISPERRDQLLGRLVVPQVIQLKVGAQVMLIKNLVQGQLVNGSLGQIIGFFTSTEAISRHLEVAQAGNEPQPIPQRDAESQQWPLVKFINGAELLMVPEEFTINNAEGGTEARRDQIPLILAWALSVHKSQGQTIERVRVDLKRTFETGQAYVAVSRATTMSQLEIVNFDKDRVTAHPRVLQWYADSQRANMEDEMDSEVAMDQYYNYH